jgi:hypothetical protein
MAVADAPDRHEHHGEASILCGDGVALFRARPFPDCGACHRRRSSTHAARIADQAPRPRAVGMPCSFKPAAMARRLVSPVGL